MDNALEQARSLRQRACELLCETISQGQEGEALPKHAAMPRCLVPAGFWTSLRAGGGPDGQIAANRGLVGFVQACRPVVAAESGSSSPLWMGDESRRSWAARCSAVTGDEGGREKRECELWPWRQDARGGS